jgi:hypothetical protein
MPPKPQPKPTTLRRTVDVVTAAAVLGLFGGLVAYQYQQRRQENLVAQAADDVVQFQQMLQLRAATKDVPLNARGWPQTIDPAWFTDGAPRNLLVSKANPWLEVASPVEAELRDPLVRMTIDAKKAGYWYNPNQGIVRARVPVGISDDQALRLYNRINGTALTSIYSKEALPKPAAPAAPAAARTVATVSESPPQDAATGEPASEPVAEPPTPAVTSPPR